MKEPAPTFSAVLLAGGKSSRMGRDKAGLIVDGRPLWERQLSVLRSLGATEVFISGKSDGPYAGAEVPVVPDHFPGCGPLAGLEAALQHSRSPLLVVLAIDLPHMTAEYLTRVVQAAQTTGAGVVPQVGSHYEPLAAIYPVRCLELVREYVQGKDRSMQSFLREAVARQFVTALAVRADEESLFRNWNTPEDLDS